MNLYLGSFEQDFDTYPELFIMPRSQRAVLQGVRFYGRLLLQITKSFDLTASKASEVLVDALVGYAQVSNFPSLLSTGANMFRQKRRNQSKGNHWNFVSQRVCGNCPPLGEHQSRFIDTQGSSIEGQ